MVIFWRLLLGHLLGDFTLQTNYINAWKRESRVGMLVHCLTHPMLYIALTYPFLSEGWVQLGPLTLNGWTCVFLLFLFHWIEDQWRVYTIQALRLMDTTLFFLWDQFIHYLCLIALFPMLTLDARLGWMPEKWPLIACLFILITHYATVLLYFIEKDLWGAEYPGFFEKHIGMLGRAVLAGAFLIPSFSGALAAAAAIAGTVALLRQSRVISYSRFSLCGGGVIAMICGLAARLILV